MRGVCKGGIRARGRPMLTGVALCAQIYHPNIDLQGAVCLNLLRKDWKPVLDTQAVIHGLIFLFLEPNPEDPLNEGALRTPLWLPLPLLPVFAHTLTCLAPRCSAAAEVLRKDKRTFLQNVEKSLRGGTVDGTMFPVNTGFKK
jgi:ubiquitin-conjugating enzyme E2 M